MGKVKKTSTTAAADVDDQALTDSDDDLFVLVEKPKKKKEGSDKHGLCKTCNTNFPDSSALIRHVKKMHKKDTVVMICGFCHKKFNERMSFNKHIATHKKK